MDKIALRNVRVFDGERLLEPATVVIDGDRIGGDQAGARRWDGDGGVLLPGLIDCHIHLTDAATLSALARHGVTTALDMGTDSPELVASLRNRPGVTDVRSSGASASAPASPPYGTSLHHELELLADAGMSAVDAVRSATIVAAQQFGLSDRGVIAAGKRADLVLIDGDPLRDISAVRKIAAVWCAGVPVAGAPGTPPAHREVGSLEHRIGEG